jgi:hypothetical protein
MPACCPRTWRRASPPVDLRRGPHLPGARQLLTIHLLSRRHLIAQAGKPGEDNGVCAAQIDRCQPERWKDPSDGCSHAVALIGHLSCPVRAGDIRDNGVVSGPGLCRPDW